jgi:hypothetical protein
MRNISDRAILEDLVRRLRGLAPTQPGLWGSMKAQQMVLHLGDASAAVLKQGPFSAKPRNGPSGLLRRWVSYAACVWAVLFAAPHIWWALGIPAGFPGGPAGHQLMMTSAWRYIFDVIVIILSALAMLIALTLLRPPHESGQAVGAAHRGAWLARLPRSGPA